MEGIYERKRYNMPHTLAILNATDYAAWKSAFHSEASIAARKAAGEKSYMLFADCRRPEQIRAS